MKKVWRLGVPSKIDSALCLVLAMLGIWPSGVRADIAFTNANGGNYGTLANWMIVGGGAPSAVANSNLVFNVASATITNSHSDGTSYGWASFGASVSNWNTGVANRNYFFTSFSNSSSANTVLWDTKTTFSNANIVPIIYNNGTLTMARTITNITGRSLVVDGSGTTQIGQGTSGGYFGTNALTKNGSGILLFSGSSSPAYSGNTTNNQGLIVINGGSGQALGVGGTLVMNGGRLASSASSAATRELTNAIAIRADSQFGEAATYTKDLYLRGAIDLDSATHTITVSNITVLAAGSITNTATLQKAGDGTLTLSGVNTYSGGTVIQNGALYINGDSALGAAGTSLMISNGATLQVSGTYTNSARAITIGAGGGAISPDAGVTVGITNSVTGTGGLTKSGSGILVLSANNSFSGSTINSGVIALGNANALGVGTVTWNGGTLSNTANITVANNINLIGNGTAWTAQLNNQWALSGNISGNGSLSLYGADSNDRFLLSGSNTFSGGITVNSGVLRLGSTNGFGAGTLTLTGGSLENNSGSTLTNANNNNIVINGNFSFDPATGGTIKDLHVGYGAVDLGAAIRTITVSKSNLTFGGSITNLGGITKAGNGVLTLAGSNTYSGDTTANAGTLIIGHQFALKNSTLNNNGGTAVFGSGATAFTLGGLAAASSGAGYDLGLTNSAGNAIALTVGNNNANALYAGVLSGAGSVTKIGSGTWTLSNSNTYSGGTTISAGNLVVSNNTGLGIGAINVSSPATLDVSGVSGGFNVNQTLTNRGTISGSLILTSGALATGGGTYGNITANSGSTLTPGVGGDTNYFSDLTLMGGSTNSFWLGSAVTHDMSVVTNSLNYGGDHPLLKLDLTSWSSAPPETIVLYNDTYTGSGWNGTNQIFQLSDWGAGANGAQLLTNGLSFWAVGGSSATNFFTIRYDYDVASSTFGSGNDIALLTTVIPEPASINLLAMLGAAYVMRRRMHRKRGRWNI